MTAAQSILFHTIDLSKKLFLVTLFVLALPTPSTSQTQPEDSLWQTIQNIKDFQSQTSRSIRDLSYRISKPENPQITFDQRRLVENISSSGSCLKSAMIFQAISIALLAGSGIAAYNREHIISMACISTGVFFQISSYVFIYRTGHYLERSVENQ